MRCTISSSHTLTALSPGSETIFHRHLRSFRRYADDESQNQNQTAVNAVGELWEPQTLQLRVTPPIVEIDNRACEDATRITLSSANRPGTLVEVVTRLVELSLVVKRALISSDREWFCDDFYVTERNGNKVKDPSKIARMQKILCIEPSSLTTHSEDMTVLEMSGQDRPGLLADVTQLLTENGYDVKSGAVWTQGFSVALVINICKILSKENVPLLQVCDKLKNIMSDHTSQDRVVVRPKRCQSHIHYEHRLHFMLLKARNWEQTHHDPNTTVSNITFKHRSPKLGKTVVTIKPDSKRGYWIVNIQSKDRNKLLFDVVCTMADLDFDFYHGNVDCRNGWAVLRLYVRRRYHPLESIQDTIEEVRQFLEAALTRRFPEGLKIHVQPLNRPGCLRSLLHELKSAGLCVMRANLRSNDHGRTVHTMYVMNSNGTYPDPFTVQQACCKVGGTLMFSGDSGTDSDSSESRISTYTFAFSILERTLDRWEAMPYDHVFNNKSAVSASDA